MTAFYSRSDDEHAAAFRALVTDNNVETMIGVPIGKLRYLAYSKKRKTYSTFRVTKRAGGHREITAPTSNLKEVQRRLLRVLQATYQPLAVVHGFRKQHSCATNAKEHVGVRWVLNLDLADFFPSITFPRVRGMLMAHPYRVPESAATLIAALCCYEGKLPQGAPTSPMLANMVCASLDGQLRALAAKCRCRYTRYADDLTFSTRKPRFPAEMARRAQDGSVELGDELRRLIEDGGFVINEAKSRLRHYSERQEVTGLVTNKRVNVPREYVRQIRAMLHAWEKHGEDAAQDEFISKYDNPDRETEQPDVFRSVVRGKLSYLAMLKGRGDPVYVRLVRRGRDRIDNFYSTKFFYSVPILEDGIVVLEGVDTDGSPAVQGTGFFLEDVGLVTCAHNLASSLTAFPWHHPKSKYLVYDSLHNTDWDVAVLRAPIEPRFAFRRGSTASLEVGARVRILGFPNWAEGRPLSVTDAVVQGEHASNFGARRFSIDNAIFGGNSGGPVLNAANEVVGIALKGMFQGDAGSENMFIPIDYVFTLISEGKPANTSAAVSGSS